MLLKGGEQDAKINEVVLSERVRISFIGADNTLVLRENLI